MGFGREVKDFIGAFQAGTKIMGAKDDKEYKRMRTKALKQKMEDDAIASPIKLDLLKARAERARRGPKGPDPEITRGRKLRNDAIERDLRDSAPPTLTPAGSPQGALDTDQPVQTSDAETPTGMDLAGDSAYGSGDDTSYGSGGTLNLAGGMDDDESDMGGDGGGYDTAALDMGGDEYAASKGGMITSRGNKPKKALKVKGYADGGAVEDDDTGVDMTDDLDTASTSDDPQGDYEDEQEESALPVSGGTTTTASAKSKPQFSYQAAHDAAKAGVEYSMKHHQDANAPEEGAVTTDMSAASRGRSAGATAHARGDGGVTRSEYETMRKQVNPDGKLSESQETMAIQAQLWEYTLKTKGPEAAERAAGSVTQYQRVVSDRYKALAKVAAEHGDVTGTIKNTLRSYANIPTGDDLSITQTPDGKNIQAEFTDQQTGKRMQKVIMTPDQMLQWATKGGVQDFDSLLARSAGGRAEMAARQAQANKAQDRQDKVDNQTRLQGNADRIFEQGERRLTDAEAKTKVTQRIADQKHLEAQNFKPGEAKAVDEQIDTAMQSPLNEGEQPIAKVVGKQAPEVKAIATQIYAANRNMPNTSDHVRAAYELTQVNPADPSKPMYTMAPASAQPKNGDFAVVLSNGQQAIVPQGMKDRIGTTWKTNRDKALAKIDADKKAAAARGETYQAGMNILKGAAAGKNGRPYNSALEDIASGNRGTPIQPSPPMTELERINAARRSTGQPPLTPEQLSAARGQ